MRLNTKQLPSDCFHFRIAGLPCIVCVTHYVPDVPAKLSGHPDTWEPPESGELEFECYDRKGYRAKWLEEKVDESVIDTVWNQYKEVLREHCQDY